MEKVGKAHESSTETIMSRCIIAAYPSSYAHPLGSHLPEGGPFFLRLHVGVVARVLGVVAGIAVRVKNIGRAQFVDGSQSNAGCVPETHGAVFMSVETQRINSNDCFFFLEYTALLYTAQLQCIVFMYSALLPMTVLALD